MSADRFSQYVDQIIDRAPQLSDEQCERIARILHSGPRSIAAANGGGRR